MRLPSPEPRLVTAAEMAALDRAAIEGRGIPSLTLMERAGRGVAGETVAWWRERERDRARGRGGQAASAAGRGRAGGGAARAAGARAVILAGRGNNGGDGFVVARHLKSAGWRPRVLVAAAEVDLSPDAAANLAACRRSRVPVSFFPEAASWDPGGEAAAACADADLYLDALLGTGSRGAPRGAIARAIECANHQDAPIVAIDIPSGLDASTGECGKPTIAAVLTVTLALPKRGLVIEPGRSAAGDVRVVDIGIPRDLVEAT